MCVYLIDYLGGVLAGPHSQVARLAHQVLLRHHLHVQVQVLPHVQVLLQIQTQDQVQVQIEVKDQAEVKLENRSL